MKCVEVAHIYANQKWSSVQEKSLNIGKEMVSEKDRLVCLIDNYNAQEFEKITIPKELSLVVYEKDLVKYTKQMKSFLNTDKIFYRKVKNKNVFFYKTPISNIPLWEEKNQEIKFYCVFLCLIWYSCRACLFSNEWFSTRPDEVVNVLDLQFKPIEDNVKLLIEDNNLDIKLNTVYY